QLAAVAIDGVAAVRIAWCPSPEALCRYALRRAFLCQSTARDAHENNYRGDGFHTDLRPRRVKTSQHHRAAAAALARLGGKHLGGRAAGYISPLLDRVQRLGRGVSIRQRLVKVHAAIGTVIDLWTRAPAERDRHSHGPPELRCALRAPHGPLQCDDRSAKHHKADNRKRDPHEPIREVLRDRPTEGNHEPSSQGNGRTPPDPMLDVLTDAPVHAAQCYCAGSGEVASSITV